MIPSEILRKYPFFSFMSHEQRNQVSMFTDEVEINSGESLFTSGEPADACYLLVQGSIDLHYIVYDEYRPELRKEFTVGTINPGELLGISAVVDPFVFTASAIAVTNSRLLKIDAVALRSIADKDQAFAVSLNRMVAKATMERLYTTRVLLAAATGPEDR